MTRKINKAVPSIIQAARARLLQMHFESGVGHIGGNLSCLDMMIVLYHQVMQSDDLLILSKGHAAGALYVSLWTLGVLTDADLKTFHKDDTRLSGHPAPHQLPEIRFATGSLGHGLSLACGVALAKRLRGEAGRVYCLMSDGEWQEGSTWEAVTFAAHHGLPITLLIDTNGLQGFGTTEKVASQRSLKHKIDCFGIPCVEIDGHAGREIYRAAYDAAETTGPRAIVAKTRKGNGISFMENKMEWHYLPLTRPQYDEALAQVLVDFK